MSKKLFCCLIFFILIVLVFKAWFSLGVITGGDFWPYYSSMYAQYPLSLSGWNPNLGTGLGGFTGLYLWIYLNLGIPLAILGRVLGFSWNVIERLYYLFPILIISLFSSSILYRKIVSKNNFFFLAALIFLFNTYSLMLIEGGQVIGVGIAYAISPFIITLFIDVLNTNKLDFKKLLQLGLVLGIQAIFDIRIAYISFFMLFIYFFVFGNFKKSKKYLLSLSIPFVIFVLINFFWIFPILIVHQNPISQLGSAYTSLNAVRFFSFAKLENTISLLHPNWPDNIFGKVSFMKPEFLLLPILAFSSLLFVSSENGKQKTEKNLKSQQFNNSATQQSNDKIILYFSLLGLIGAFLAKGAQDPFGQIYLFLFQHVPGFIMFRDPTKWYTLVAISYAILIPYAVSKIYDWLKLRSKFQFSIKSKLINFQNLFLLLVICYLLFLIRPALFGQLNGTLKTTTIPPEYKTLEQDLIKNQQFFRTFWLPTIQRFGYSSANHPTIAANDFFNLNSAKDDVVFLNKKNTLKLLQESSVKYVIVPYDSLGEIFLTDRKYDQKSYLQTIKDLNSISWLKKVNGFGRIAVYEVPNPRDHFWSPDANLQINYQYINPTKYIVSVTNAKKGDMLIFAESYDLGWRLSSSKFKVQSSKFKGLFNSFVIPESGNYSLEIDYQPQKWVDIGSVVSLVSFVIVICLLFFVSI